MSNPIFDDFNQSNNQQNTLSGMWGQVKNSPNPELAIMNMFSQQAIQDVINYTKQHGGDARTAFYNMAAEKGVDPNSVLQFLK